MEAKLHKMEFSSIAMRVVYLANIVVAGWIGITCLFTDRGAVTVFENTVVQSEGLRVVVALWLAIALCSALGLIKPEAFAAVLVLQLLYKGMWLLFVALPAMKSSSPYPKGMAGFFVVWVLVLPFVIPWKKLLVLV